MLDIIVGRLPAAWQPYAKAVLPAIVTLIGVLAQVIPTGDFTNPALATAITGLVAVVLTFLAPNQKVTDPRIVIDEGDAGQADVPEPKAAAATKAPKS